MIDESEILGSYSFIKTESLPDRVLAEPDNRFWKLFISPKKTLGTTFLVFSTIIKYVFILIFTTILLACEQHTLFTKPDSIIKKFPLSK